MDFAANSGAISNYGANAPRAGINEWITSSGRKGAYSALWSRDG